jgi:DNA invertase Pin-like site-specific DNA recombinase
MRIATYLRVSTSEQTVAGQRVELEEYASRRGWAIAHEYADQISGAAFSRNGLDAMMKEVRKGRIDVVLCSRLDRLGRSLSHLAGLLDEFSTHGVGLVCPAQGVDTSNGSPAARFQIDILGAVAAFERGLVRERTMAGLAAARKRGKLFGRPRVIDQYRDRVLELQARGFSRRKIAGELGIPASNVNRLIAKAA